MKQAGVFVSAVMAGVCIAIGGTVFLALESRVLGALLFTVGLFSICTLGLDLFTGRVCFILGNDRAYALAIPVIWLGNLAGTGLVAALESLTRIGPALTERAAELCRVKLGDELSSIFILAMLCNVLIYIAVENFKSCPHELGRYLALLFGVVVFILCGFEHCVANMYYFSMAGAWSGRTLVYLLVMSAGNATGGVALPLLSGWMKK